jgi:mxaL protein
MKPFRNARFWLMAAAAALLALAASGLRWPLKHDVYDAIVVVDITGSMNVRDLQLGGRPVSRLDFAKAALVRLLAAMPCQSRLGLAVFSERRPFMLFEPAETCENFAAIAGAIEALDWRMAWEGDSHIATGLYRSIDLAKSLGASLLFISDGHEAPPLPAAAAPAFEGKPGDVMGLIAGVGGYGLSPIPKFDDNGQEIGFYAAEDVPHENRTGLPPKDAQYREGWNERNAPFGAAVAVGNEHLSSLREAHLTGLAAKTGLAYVRLDSADLFAGALFKAARPRRLETSTSVGFIPAAMALALIVLVYASAFFTPLRRKDAS